jgi:hypothetical protein
MTNEHEGRMSNGQGKDDPTQRTKPPRSKLKRALPLIALVAAVGVLVLGELAFQWAKHRGWATGQRLDLLRVQEGTLIGLYQIKPPLSLRVYAGFDQGDDRCNPLHLGLFEVAE